MRRRSGKGGSPGELAVAAAGAPGRERLFSRLDKTGQKPGSKAKEGCGIILEETVGIRGGAGREKTVTSGKRHRRMT
ncbi:MAG: hypothetical protein LBG06_01035 [Deltaproteobacteria bacterium]|nr:hypothetical protein [Deltaproteobacteria bacterium]